MDSSEGAEATVGRLLPTAREVLGGLRSGLAIAQRLHAAHGWNPQADLHLFHHLARREAMEHLRERNPRLEEGVNLGLPMSGLLLRPTAFDVVRVWYSDDPNLKAPESEAGRAFVTQRSSGEDLFSLLEDDDPQPAAPCRTFIRWASTEQEISRFDLVRPLAIVRGNVVHDWSVDLLPLLDGGG